MNTKTNVLLTLIALSVIDAIIPIPLTGLLLIYIVVQKPSWFSNIVRHIYAAN